MDSVSSFILEMNMDVKKTRDCRLYKSRRNETVFLTVEEALAFFENLFHICAFDMGLKKWKPGCFHKRNQIPGSDAYLGKKRRSSRFYICRLLSCEKNIS